MKKNISRRDFLKGMAAGASAAVIGSLSSSAVFAADAADESWMPDHWDDEADVVIVGFGGAGALAAIATAHEGGTSIIIEKSPEVDGGSTAASGGHIHTCIDADIDEWGECVKHGSFGSVPEDMIRPMLEHAAESRQWFDTYGINLLYVDESNDGHKRPLEYAGAYVEGRDGRTGLYLFEELYDVATGYGAEIRTATPAKKLIQNPITKEVVGVEAENADGEALYFKAKKGVILACGGYENNPAMQYNFNYPGVRIFPWGTPYNTGDGITMAAAVGAKLWHLHGLEFSSLNYKVPSEIANCSISTDATSGITPYNYVIVNFEGKRFMKEDKTGAHDMDHQPALDFDGKTCDYKNLPMFLIFDQTMFDEKPLWEGTGRQGIVNTYAGVYNYNHPDDPWFVWGDNENALSEGWIFKGETIEELAANITGERPCGFEGERIEGIDAEALAETIAAWNDYCANGEDPDFERDPDHMLPLDNPPYYAIELGNSCINTQGGPMRNADCQTLDAFEVPIPRLYNVGELGSYNGHVYYYGNIFEAMTTGRVAAQHALKLDDWE